MFFGRSSTDDDDHEDAGLPAREMTRAAVPTRLLPRRSKSELESAEWDPPMLPSNPGAGGRGITRRCNRYGTRGHNRFSEMVAMGREELLMKEAEVHKSIVFKANNRDRVGLTTVELSHLHQQLQGITTTCTLIIGFAMASLSADLLTELGNDTGIFCVYKSVAATLLSSLFIILTTTCICACFTIIACVQIIIFQSQRAIFSRAMIHRVQKENATRRRGHQMRRVNLTERVVRMTQLLMYGDAKASFDRDKGSQKDLMAYATRSSRGSGGSKQDDERLAFGGFTIYIGLGIALACFFCSTVILVWIFLSPLARWRQYEPGASDGVTAAAMQGGGSSSGGVNASSTNPHLVRTYNGMVKSRCLDPYNDGDESLKDVTGMIISLVVTFIFASNVFVGWRVASRTVHRYDLESLLELPDTEDDEDGLVAGNANRQGFEDDEHRGTTRFSHGSGHLSA